MTLDSGTILLTGSYSIIGSHEGSNELSYGKIVKFLASSTLGFKLGDATNYQFNNYGLMGDGYTGFQYTGNGANKNNPVYKASPVHPTIFNKLKQGWASPITLKTGVYGYGLNGAGFEQYNDETKVELFNANTQSNQFNAFKVIDKNNVNIHYLIENRATDKLYNYDVEDNDV
jgi:hypothetical protein